MSFMFTRWLRFMKFVSSCAFPKYVIQRHHRSYKFNGDSVSSWTLFSWIFSPEIFLLLLLVPLSSFQGILEKLSDSRKKGGRGLAIIEDSADASIKRLEDYIEKHEGGLITATRNDTDNTINDRMRITRKQQWGKSNLCPL